MKKNIIFIISCALLLLTSCALDQNGRIVRTVAGQQIVLSEYFESEHLVEEKSLLIHLVSTLGKERIPPGKSADIPWEQRKFNDRIEQVGEIYFTNNGDKPITIDSIFLSYDQRKSRSVSYSDKAITIAPQTFFKTNAHIGVTSLYRVARARRLSLNIDGVAYEINMKERRVPVSELR